MEVTLGRGAKPTPPNYRLTLLTSLVFLASAVLAPALATAAPANDDFEQATVLEGFPVSVTASTLHATAQSGEPGYPHHGSGHSVWFKWISPVTQWVGVQVRRPEARADEPGHGVAVFTGDALTELESRGTGGAQDSRLTFDSAAIDAVAGTTYWIKVETLHIDNPYVDDDFPSEGGGYWLGIARTCWPLHKSWLAARNRARAKKEELDRTRARFRELKRFALLKAQRRKLIRKVALLRAELESSGTTKARRRYLKARQRVRSVRLKIDWIDGKRAWLKIQLKRARDVERQTKARAKRICSDYY